MRKALITILFLLVICQTSYAGKRYNSNTGTKDYCLDMASEDGSTSNITCKDIRFSGDSSVIDEDDYFLILTGMPLGGQTSQTSGNTSIPVTYSYVKIKILQDQAYWYRSLDDARSGDMVTVQITEAESGGKLIIVPDTSTSFSSVTMYLPGDRVTFLYIDDTVGWIMVEQYLQLDWSTAQTTRLIANDSPYTADIDEQIIFADTDDGLIEIELPGGIEGKHFRIINAGSSGNGVSLSASGIQLLYGTTSVQDLYDGEIFNLYYNTTEGWW